MKTDAGEISRRLAARVEEVCQHLIPGGEIAGGEYRVAGIGGGKGQSLGVHLRGGKAGIWCDFSTDTDKGDLLDLWAAVRGCPLGQAIQEAKQFLGIQSYAAENRTVSYSKPKFRGVVKFASKPESPALAYLINDRKIPKEVINLYRVAEGNDPEFGVGLSYPCFQADKDVAVNATFIALARKDGKKQSKQESGCAPCLFGWQAFPKTEPAIRQVIITEGQIDAMTWAAWGCTVPALSIPSGTGNDKWIDYEWDNLEQFETIFLCFDEDEPGHKAVLSTAKRLGIHRCRIVRLPAKDANQTLLEGAGGEEAAKFLMESRHLSPEEIKKPMDFWPEIERDMFPSEADLPENGFRVPIFDGRFRIRPGEVTLWTGYTSHGKTTLLNQVMLHAMAEGQRVAIGSFEMRPRMLLRKMIVCLLGTSEPTRDQAEWATRWLNERLWLFSVIGQISPNKLEELMTYSIARHGINQFVVDSLMKISISPDDYEKQQNFMNSICSMAINNDVHIHIVGHPRKDKDDLDMPGIMDVHGGQSVTAQPDNMVSVWRNKKKEMSEEDGKPQPLWPDTIAQIRKQRATGEEPKYKFWFNRHTNSFTQDMDPDTNRPVYPKFL